MLFYVEDSLIKRPRDGKEIAYLLKQKLSDNFFEFRMQEVEPYGMFYVIFSLFSSTHMPRSQVDAEIASPIKARHP